MHSSSLRFQLFSAIAGQGGRTPGLEQPQIDSAPGPELCALGGAHGHHLHAGLLGDRDAFRLVAPPVLLRGRAAPWRGPALLGVTGRLWACISSPRALHEPSREG